MKSIQEIALEVVVEMPCECNQRTLQDHGYATYTTNELQNFTEAVLAAYLEQQGPVGQLYTFDGYSELLMFDEVAQDNFKENPGMYQPVFLAPPIKPGYVMVPEEPTFNMIHEGNMSRLCTVSGSESVADIYKAMLQSAKGEE